MNLFFKGLHYHTLELSLPMRGYESGVVGRGRAGHDRYLSP